MKDWLSNPLAWMSGNNQNQSQHYPQGPLQHPHQGPPFQSQPQSYPPQSSQNQFNNPAHVQRPQQFQHTGNPSNDFEKKDRMIQEFKDNFDGCGYTLAEKEISDVFDNHGWNPSLATPFLIELFTKNKTEYFTAIYSDLDQKEVITTVEGNTLDRKIIEVLNEKRKELIGGKLSEAYQEIQRLKESILDQKNTITSLEIDNTELKEKLASEGESNSNIIQGLNDDKDNLSNELSLIRNQMKESDDLIKGLRKSTKLLLNEIQELKEGTCIKAPSSVDFGNPIQVIWKLDGHISNTSDWVGLFDCNGELINSQIVNSQGSKSGKMTFDAPATYGEYYFKYFQVTSTFLGISSNNAELSISNVIKVGPTYSIIEEKNEPGEIVLQIQRETGKFYFHSFTFGMYKIGGAYDEYLEMYNAKEGENITFHPDKEEPLFNYEFRVFGEMSEGVICTLCILGHTSFIQKRKRENFKTNTNKNSMKEHDEEEEERSTKRKKSNSEERVEEIEMDDSENNNEDKSQSHGSEVDSDHHISSDCSDDSS